MIRRRVVAPVRSSGSSRRRTPAHPVEPLENRLLLHSGALQVLSVVADNRGEMLIMMNQPVRPSNVNTGAIQMYTAGPDGILANADDTRVTTQLNYQAVGNRIVIRADLPAGSAYRVKIVSARMTTADGHAHLDGDFRGVFPSGNGLEGGNFEFQTKLDKSAAPIVRMSTSQGVITLRMRGDAAPQTVNNFLTYSNAGDYDNSFITRSVPGFILQAGSLQINGRQQIVEGAVRAPVANEFRISNTRGTLALAKQGNDPDSATNQFFFNLADNSKNLDNQNGGFTVFAQVANGSSLNVMDAIAAKPIVALHNPLTGDGVLPSFSTTGITDVPVNDAKALAGPTQAVDGQGSQRTVVTQGLDPARDLITIRRVASLMRIVPL